MHFEKVTGRNSFKDLATALSRGATLDTSSKGFHARNTLVARKADYMIAFTFHQGDTPGEKGGTADTWRKAKQLDKKHKIHVSLSTILTTHSPAAAAAAAPVVGEKRPPQQTINQFFQSTKRKKKTEEVAAPDGYERP